MTLNLLLKPQEYRKLELDKKRWLVRYMLLVAVDCRISIQGLYNIIRNSGKRSCWNLQFSNDFRTVLILIFRVPQIQGSV